MSNESSFLPSFPPVCRVKMYKARFRKWGWRKNIRFDRPLVLHNDARFLPVHMAAPISTPDIRATAEGEDQDKDHPSHQPEPAATGIVVQQERLKSYLRRRERRRRASSKKMAAAAAAVVHAGGPCPSSSSPRAIKPPDRFWASQIVLIHVQQYLVSSRLTCFILFLLLPSFPSILSK